MRMVSRDLNRAEMMRAGHGPRSSRGRAASASPADDEMTQVSDINVTPFIDVILVLRIIFMIAAPRATVDIAVDLSRLDAVRQPRPDKPIFITLKPTARWRSRKRRSRG